MLFKIVSGAEALQIIKAFLDNCGIGREQAGEYITPSIKPERKTRHPNSSPTPIPVNIDRLARFGFPAPTFWETKEAMDCISALGISMAKFTILQATPYPEEASSPNLFTNAQSARKDIWVRNSWRARGSPIPRKRLHWELKHKSDFFDGKGKLLFQQDDDRTYYTDRLCENGCESCAGGIQMKPCNQK